MALEFMKEHFDAFKKLQIETESFASYIADYVMEEQARGNVEVDKYMIMDAISAYKGGAK
jgi:hypothetical protein